MPDRRIAPDGPSVPADLPQPPLPEGPPDGPLKNWLSNPSLDETAGEIATGWGKFVLTGTPTFVAWEEWPWMHTRPGKSQRIWTHSGSGAAYTAGIYQTVTLDPGNEYRFCAWVTHFAEVPTDGPTTFSVGYRGNRGTDPVAASWGTGLAVRLTWEEVCVDFLASSSTVTVFVKAAAASPASGERSSFIDDTSLVVVSD